MGAVQIMAHPEILMAINPAYAFNFFKDNPTFGYLVLGSVVLGDYRRQVYADMGHLQETH